MNLFYLLGILIFYLKILKEEFTSTLDFFVIFLVFYVQLFLDMLNVLFPSLFESLRNSASFGKTPVSSLFLSQHPELPLVILLSLFILYSFFGSRGMLQKISILKENSTQGYLRILVVNIYILIPSSTTTCKTFSRCIYRDGSLT